MFARLWSVTCSYVIEKHARVPNEPFDAEEDAANFDVELVDCSSYFVCCTRFTMERVQNDGVV